MEIKLVVKNSKGQKELRFKIIRSLSGNLVDLNIGIVPLRELGNWLATFGYTIINAKIVNDNEKNNKIKEV